MKPFSYPISESNPRRDGLWNMAGNLVNAMQSILLLAFVTRLCGTDTAGIFSITFSMAQMMYMVAGFEMNNVLVTDTGHTIGLRETIFFRLGSNFLMCLCALAAGALQGFSGEKALTFALLIGHMLLLSWAELCESHLFHNRHLDLAGKSLALNLSLGTCLFVLVLGLTGSTYGAIGAMCCMTLAWIAFYSIPCLRAVKPRWRSAGSGGETILRLVRLCAPLLVCHLTLSYIINAPKLAIDTHLSLWDQSCYSYLLMPAASVNLVSLFAVRPQMPALAKACHEGNRREFSRLVGRLLLWDLLISVAVLAGGYLLGTQLLSLFYGVDLSGCRSLLCMLLLGGCFYAYATLLDVVATAMRIHHWNLPVYLATALAALVAVSPMVARYRLWGAAWAYVLCMLSIVLCSGCLVLYKIMKLPDKKTQ